MRRLVCSLLALTLLAGTAHAQEDNSNAALNDRLDRLERDMNFVQKQVYRNSGGSASDASGAPVPVNAGQVQVRFSQIDEEIRQIRGLIEQTQYQNKQTSDDLKKLSADVDYRLRALEQNQAAAASAAAAAAAAPAPAPVAQLEPTTPLEPAVAAKPVPTPAADAVAGNFPDAKTHYDYAYKLYTEKKYPDATASFDQFVKKYPSDPLTANAYFWMGESQYSRSDFTRAAESFRKGFEANPDGQKAPDNLYKLAMSLNQIKRKTEACVVLNQVVTKYAETAPRTVAKAQDGITTMQCK